MNTQELDITGMTCDACAGHVRKALFSVRGVQGAEVSYPQRTARVTVAPAIDLELLATAVRTAGYGMTPKAGAPVGADTREVTRSTDPSPGCGLTRRSRCLSPANRRHRQWRRSDDGGTEGRRTRGDGHAD